MNNYGLLGGDRLSMAQGALEQTGNPLDLAIEGQGFFMVQTPNGPRYTRDGSFHRSQNGQLVTQAGEPVLSRDRPADSDSAGRSFGGRRRRALGGGRRGGAGGRLHVSCGHGADAGRRQPLCRAAGSDAGTTAKDAAVHQGALEAANQDVVQGSLDLIMMQRQAEMMQRALTVFHTEFNKFATEDLPKCSARSQRRRGEK